jgi:hypothetical protein
MARVEGEAGVGSIPGRSCRPRTRARTIPAAFAKGKSVPLVPASKVQGMHEPNRTHPPKGGMGRVAAVDHESERVVSESGHTTKCIPSKHQQAE